MTFSNAQPLLTFGCNESKRVSWSDSMKWEESLIGASVLHSVFNWYMTVEYRLKYRKLEALTNDKFLENWLVHFVSWSHIVRLLSWTWNCLFIVYCVLLIVYSYVIIVFGIYNFRINLQDYVPKAYWGSEVVVCTFSSK